MIEALAHDLGKATPQRFGGNHTKVYSQGFEVDAIALEVGLLEKEVEAMVV